jgi:hypothetical protein
MVSELFFTFAPLILSALYASRSLYLICNLNSDPQYLGTKSNMRLANSHYILTLNQLGMNPILGIDIFQLQNESLCFEPFMSAREIGY